MKLLLDTHLLLWCAAEPSKISKKIRTLLEAESSELFFSAANIWEITIQNHVTGAGFDINPHVLRRGLLDNDWQELEINSHHAIAAEKLPAIHKDPFDRILLAQAEVEGMTLLTNEVLLKKYPVAVKVNSTRNSK